MDAVSGMQQKILRYIQRTLDERGVAPSVREIGDAVGLSSTSSVQYNLNKLERMGCIERDPNCKRTIRLPGRAAQGGPGAAAGHGDCRCAHSCYPAY